VEQIPGGFRVTDAHRTPLAYANAMIVTANTAQILFEGAGVERWNVCACVICGGRAGYVFEEGKPPMWRGDHKRCSEPLPPRPSSWQDVADHLNALPGDMLDGTLRALVYAMEQKR
jgi:hypothetical protein